MPPSAHQCLHAALSSNNAARGGRYTPPQKRPPAMLRSMANLKGGRRVSTGWLSEIGKYVVLVIVGAIAVALVIIAFSRPGPTPSRDTPSPPHQTSAPSASPSPTPSASPSATPEPSSAKITFLGDDYTAGDGASAPSLRWTTLLSVANNWSETNAGVDSTGFGTAGKAPGAAAFTDRVQGVIAEAPDIVFVSGGRFDYTGNASATQVSQAIVETFARLRSELPTARIVATNVIWPAEPVPPRLTTISEEIESAVLSVNGFFLDLGQPLAAEGSLAEDEGSLLTDAGHVALFESIRAEMEGAPTSEQIWFRPGA
ncbi:MAG: SGNH/GDSL hydrolase family protein [Glaciihabitans sp.]